MSHPSAPRPSLKLAIAGFGAIGQALGRRVDRGDVAHMALTAISGRDAEKAGRNAAALSRAPSVVSNAALADHADVVVECAPAAVFREIAAPAVERGRIFIPLSCGALLQHMDLVDRAAETGARILVPTGALIALDAVKAIAQGAVERITLETRKPPRGLAGAPHLLRNGIEIDDLDAPKKVFAGTARDAAIGFPANVNVAAALSLAGVGPDKTAVEIWADPGVTRNTHTIRAVSDSSNFTVTIENIPSEETPATGKVTALSVIALLKGLTAPLSVGT